jgi:YD repeat-containing protein
LTKSTLELRIFAFALIGLCGGTRAQLPPLHISPPPVVNIEYDAQGNITKAIVAPDSNSLTTTHGYDRLHRRTLTTDARGKFTNYEYQRLHDLVQITDPRGLVTHYPRNGLGDSLGLTSPDTGTAVHTIDAAGNLLTRLDSRGVLATHSYDPLNRLTSITYNRSGQPSQSFSWGYDQSGPGFSNGIGRLTSTQFPGGSSTFSYDPQGRLISTTQTVISSSTTVLTVGYGYDAAGRITSITYPSGRVLSIPHIGGLPAAISLTPAGGSGAIGLLADLRFEPRPPEFDTKLRFLTLSLRQPQ